MTTYVCPMPYEPNRYHLFADDPDEALMAAFGAGAGMEAARPDRSPLHYDLTWQQVLAARALGAVDCDVVAPYEAAARWADNRGALASAQEWRAGLTAPADCAPVGV